MEEDDDRSQQQLQLQPGASLGSRHSLSQHSTHSKGSRKSKGVSLNGSTLSSSDDSFGKQITDTGVRKLIFMMQAFLSLALHIVYLVFTILLHSNNGWVLPFDPTAFQYAGPLIMQTISIASYVALNNAMNDALSAYAGYLLSRKEGYSIAICGFVHSSFMEKLHYSNRLSYRSTIKPFVNKLSLLYLGHAINLILPIFASTAINSSSSRILGSFLMCLHYSQDYSPLDRGLPTITNEMGVAELIDSTAFYSTSGGVVTITTSPQLTDVCQDGSTIIGPGLVTNLTTECFCSTSASSSDLTSAYFPSTLAPTAAVYAKTLGLSPGWINGITQNANGSIQISTILTGTNVCGGINSTSPSSPVCVTTVFSQEPASVIATYKTDGTPASIAIRKADPILIDSENPADLGYLLTSLKNLFGGSTIQYNILPPHWPGSLNPMLWMTSENMQAVSSGHLASGVSSSVGLLIRAAVQRSYTVTGGFCQQTVSDTTTVTLKIADYGFYFGIIWVCIQLLINFLVFAAYIPWMISYDPLLPGILICQEHVIFSLVASKSEVAKGRMKSIPSNLEPALIWPRLDAILRIGESVVSVEDPERGLIALDKPRLVGPLNYVKTYI